MSAAWREELRKLSDEEVREIRARYWPKSPSMRQLAEEYGVGLTTIWRILNDDPSHRLAE